ncbi:PAS and helix-turn-helix domain-containing protein [Novipirellula artificiosorum]|uniref:Bacterial regulatory protein, luxR family n=1 Tax=Novipirellula artificiosorum TaxID=2528016 RepID=A0A5C6DJC0_9BACT|nr:PAS and helix-turn-helix domain-containing protein [Novipirellula artificiosorum]TWU34999.1 Bacterial regulatory protein, luxR family [Novipirellula artificiosorum]
MHHRSAPATFRSRIDPPELDPGSIWRALSRTPGVGVSITDAEGRLLFVNDTSKVLFSKSSDIDYEGKRISDFHPPEFVAERLELIARVLREGKPLSLCHIYHGRRIESTVWPIRDRTPPFNRVIVVTQARTADQSHHGSTEPQIESVKTQYIGLGPLQVLTRRELEVLVLLGHGLSVPRAAAVLHRSPKTIERHKDSISKKLKLHGQANLVTLTTSIGLELSDAKLKRFSSDKADKK